MGKYYEQKNTKSGYLICAVPSCQTKKSTTTLKTFEFPSDLKRRNQWISAIVDATLKNEEETSPLEDLYAFENRRMELEMEISGVLGDHSYVCARHFQPEDIIVHPNVCRLTANAIPSIFKSYPINLPRQFFKKICQSAVIIQETPVKNVKNEEFNNACCEMVMLDASESDALDNSARKKLISILSSPNETLSNEEILVSSGPNQADSEDDSLDSSDQTTLSSVSTSCMSKAKMRKRLRTLELRHRQMKSKLVELENKFNLYNIDTLERDAANKNEEALFLLDMLRTYTVFEKTRKEILSNGNDS